MNTNSTSINKPLYIYAIKGAATAIISLLIKTFVSAILWAYYSRGADGIIGELPNYAVFIVSFVGSVLVYNSVVSLFSTRDPASAAEYLSAASGEYKERSYFIKTYAYASFITEAAVCISILSVAALLGASPEIAGMLYFEEGIAPHSSGIVPFSVTAILCTLIYTISRAESVRYWRYLRKRLELDELERKLVSFVKLVIIFVLYPLLMPFSPLLAYIAYTAAMVVVELALALTVPGLIALVLILIAAIYSLRLYTGYRRRKAFLRSLFALSGLGYTVFDLKNPYRSLFSVRHQCTFVLEYKKKSYGCILMTTPRKKIPLCFESESEASYRRRIGTRVHNISFEHRFSYALPDQPQRLIIVDPTPKDVLITDGDKERRLFNADKLWDYVIYEGKAFIGAAERECLGRSEIYRA